MPRNGPPPHGFPDDLPEGATVADLPPHEIQERAETFAQLFDITHRHVKAFLEAGCPRDEVDEIQRQWTALLDYCAGAFRGAYEWRETQEGALRAAIAEGAFDGPPENVPAHVLAAFWCDVAFEAEEGFWATIRENEAELTNLARLEDARARTRLQ